MSIGRLKTTLNRAWARARFGADGNYWAEDWQLVIFPDSALWLIRPNLSATNETLVDGRRVSSELILADGMVIGVGREATRVVRTPIVVRLG